MLLFLLVLVFFLFVFVFINMRAGPGVNASPVLVRDLRIIARLSFQLDSPILRNIQDKLFVDYCARLCEVMLHPELAGREWRLSDSDEFVFQFFSGPQSRYGDVLLPIVGVNRSIPLERNA